VGSRGPGETHPNGSVVGRCAQQVPSRDQLANCYSSPRALCPFQLPALWSNLASALVLGLCRVPCRLLPATVGPGNPDSRVRGLCPAWPGHRFRRREGGSTTLGTIALGSPPASFPRARGQSVSPACLPSPPLRPGPHQQSGSQGSRSPPAPQTSDARAGHTVSGVPRLSPPSLPARRWSPLSCLRSWRPPARRQPSAATHRGRGAAPTPRARGRLPRGALPRASPRELARWLRARRAPEPGAAGPVRVARPECRPPPRPARAPRRGCVPGCAKARLPLSGLTSRLRWSSPPPVASAPPRPAPAGHRCPSGPSRPLPDSLCS
jgi:hypothetical protein